MVNNNNIELSSSKEKNENTWDLARPLLNSEDHTLRNRGVNILIHRLSEKTNFQLLQEDEESYREGFDLLLERVEDENYTVRMFAVTTLAVVLEATEGREQYNDIYEKALVEVVKATKDESSWVSEHAKDIIKEIH